MFAKIVGKRTTALATSLAVVVGLVITPAFAANATEGVEPPAPLAELVEAQPAPVVETPPAEAPPAEAPPAELVEAPPADAPLAEPVEAPLAPQTFSRSSEPEPLSMNLQAAGISPSSIGHFVVGAAVNIQFSGADADRWKVSLDGFRGVDMSDSGLLTGAFTRVGSHALTVQAQTCYIICWTSDSKRYTFNVLPVITITALPDATVGVSYNQRLDATRNSEPWVEDVFTLTGNLPPGLSLNRDSGRITGTVTTIPSNPVTYSFSVQLAHDPWIGTTYYSAPQPLSITVGYPAPVVNSTVLPNATVGAPYSAPALTAAGQGTITWSATGLPAGLSINSATGVVSGSAQYNPAYGSSTAVPVTVIADNGRASAPRVLALTVLTPAPQFGAGTLPAATVGVPYDVTLPLYNAFGDITFTLESGTLPTGLQLTADGHISGTPAYDASGGASKPVLVEVRAVGTAGESIKRFNFVVLTSVPAIDTASLAAGWWKQTYSQTVQATGPGVVVSVTGLPNGLTFDGTTITGSTRATGDHTVTVTAINGAGSVDRDLTLTIHAKPDLHRMPIVKMQTGEHFWGYPGLDGHQVTLALGADAPAGMTLAAERMLEWTPTTPGVYKFTITASNPAGTDTQKYTFKVFDVPVITQGDLDHGVLDMPFTQALDHEGTNVKFNIVRGALPDGLELTKAGVLTGTPTQAGVYSIKVRAKNPVGADTKWFTVTVLEPAVTTSASTIIRGGSVTISGSGYLPGDDLELWLHSSPVLLGTVTATDGTFTSTVVIPANTAAGAHHVVVIGAQSGTQSVPLTVALPPAAPQVTTPQSQNPPSQSPQLTVTPGGDEPTVDAAIEDADADQGGDATGGDTAGDDEELPTLNEPKAEDEAAAETPANLSGLLVGGFALLLAALLLWFILWRRRRTAE